MPTKSVFHKFAIALALFAVAPACAATLTFEGTFTSDDQLAMIDFSLSGPGSVILRTEGYAGNVADGRSSGGFDPVLSLFDSTGFLIGLNRDGGCPPVSSDPATGNCWVSYLALPLPAGSYFLALTEEDNLSFGPTFADGFSRSGEGNFTPGLTGIPGDSFLDLSPSQRNGNWAVVLEGVDAPEPGALGLVLIGIVKILWPRINGNKRELAARTFLLLVFSLTFVASGYGTTGVLSDDATVQVGYASSNFGALPNLQVGPNSRALLKFQLGADLPVVTRARVKLWVNKVGNPGSVWLESAAGTWDERSVTFANAPLLDVSNISVIDVGSANSYVVADVTVFVARALTRGAGDVSFGLVGTSSTDVIFDSKENTATGHAPELELDLAGPVGPVGPIGPAGAAGPVGPAGSVLPGHWLVRRPTRSW
jgi:hypothetical protein